MFIYSYTSLTNMRFLTTLPSKRTLMIFLLTAFFLTPLSAAHYTRGHWHQSVDGAVLPGDGTASLCTAGQCVSGTMAMEVFFQSTNKWTCNSDPHHDSVDGYVESVTYKGIGAIGPIAIEDKGVNGVFTVNSIPYSGSYEFSYGYIWEDGVTPNHPFSFELEGQASGASPVATFHFEGTGTGVYTRSKSIQGCDDTPLPGETISDLVDKLPPPEGKVQIKKP